MTAATPQAYSPEEVRELLRKACVVAFEAGNKYSGTEPVRSVARAYALGYASMVRVPRQSPTEDPTDPLPQPSTLHPYTNGQVLQELAVLFGQYVHAPVQGLAEDALRLRGHLLRATGVRPEQLAVQLDALQRVWERLQGNRQSLPETPTDPYQQGQAWGLAVGKRYLEIAQEVLRAGVQQVGAPVAPRVPGAGTEMRATAELVLAQVLMAATGMHSTKLGELTWEQVARQLLEVLEELAALAAPEGLSTD